MVAGLLNDHPDHIINIGSDSEDKILKTGVIYGAMRLESRTLSKLSNSLRILLSQGQKRTNELVSFHFFWI